MNSEVDFFKKVNEKRVQFSEVGRPGFNARAVLYVNAAVNYAEALGVQDLPISRINFEDDEDTIQLSLFKLEEFMDRVKARNLFAIEPNLNDATVMLDDNWKAKSTTLITHMRTIVSEAEMPETQREQILRSLRSLQSEVDRNRTRLDAVSDAWLQITSAIGQGAENLEPAIKIIERLSKAFGKAKKYEIEHVDHPQLPPPDTLGDE